VDIHILQGERSFVKDNKTIGKFQLSDIPPAQRGVPQIQVTFDIDANGILNVNAKDLGTGKEQKIVITASGGLSKEEIEKMRQDAETYAEEDKLKQQDVQLRNDADNSSYRLEKLSNDNIDKLSDENKTKINQGVTDLQESLKGTDHEVIKTAMGKCNEIWQTITTHLSEETAKNPPPPTDAPPFNTDLNDIFNADILKK